MSQKPRLHYLSALIGPAALAALLVVGSVTNFPVSTGVSKAISPIHPAAGVAAAPKPDSNRTNPVQPVPVGPGVALLPPAALAPLPTATPVATTSVTNHALDQLAAANALLKAGQYRQAAAAYGTYIDNNPHGDVATARLQRGKALLLAGAASDAVADLLTFLRAHPNDPRVGEAALLAGQAFHQTGQDSTAVGFLQAFLKDHSNVPQRADLLKEAQEYSLSSIPSSQSAGSFFDPAYGLLPASAAAPLAAFTQGWNAYEALNPTAARADWQTVLDRWPSNPGSSSAALWLGKLAQRAGNDALAQKAYDLAWNASHGSYYGFRSHELLTQLKPDTPPIKPPTVSSDVERAQFESWLADWTDAPAGAISQPYVGAEIANGNTLNSIADLMKSGMRSQAIAQYTAARYQYDQDPRSLYALAEVTSRVGLVTQSMDAAYRILILSPAANSFQAPVYLQRLVYPYPYRDLVETAAKEHGIDPLLLIALMKRESSFDPNVTSGAGAFGLTQVLPGTAAIVAPGIGITGFTASSLYDPRVSIEIGAAYLASEIKTFNNPYLALAAYNAGDGSVRSWLSDNPRNDVDLLAEEIPIKETYDYLRLVYRYYKEYQYLYGNGV